MDEQAPPAPSQPPPPGQPARPESEMSREERIAAARAKAEALKAQRAAATPAQSSTGPAAPPAAPQGARGRATAANPGGAPPTAPQHPKVEALGTITQSVELRADPAETQNLERLLGGLGLYRNPLRGAWQLDYRYFAEARRRLEAAGYQVEGRDYLGRPLEQWAPHTRGWTRLGTPD